MTNTGPAAATTGPRSAITEHAPSREGNGSTRNWTRMLRGVPHSFTAVTMPDGERRYAVTRYNGYGDDGTDAGRQNGMRFGCAWSRVAFWTVRPPVAAPAQDEVPAAEFPVGSDRDYAARTAVLALTAPQRLALADVARGGDTPGMGMHAARRSVLEAKGLATSQRVGTGRGAWTRVDLTDLGRDGLAVLADAEGGEFAVAHAVMVGQELDASRRADDDVQAAELDDQDATDAAAMAPRVDDEDADEAATPAQREAWAPTTMVTAASTVPVIPVIHPESGAVFARPADAEPYDIVWCETADHPATGHTRQSSCVQATDTPDDGGPIGGPTMEELAAESTVDEAGTYATLDEAEHGQPLASLERLVDLADRYATEHAAALARDHAGTVRARIVELEREVERLAGVDQGLADEVAAHESTRFLNAELGRKLEQNGAAYRDARSRITALEDAPVRKHARRLVEALVRQRDGMGLDVSLPISHAAGLLADALGMDVTRPEDRQPAPAAEPHVSVAHDVRAAMGLDEAAPVIGHLDEVTDPRRALEALGIQVRPGLPGERLEVREVERPTGQAMPRVRVLGFLTDGVLRTDEGRMAREVPGALVPAYVDHVRGLGFPAPTARRLAFGCALADAERDAAR